jgi:hypothetical protein
MKREAVNEFIPTSSTFDGVIDFDKVVRDPNDPTRLTEVRRASNAQSKAMFPGH